MSIAKASGELLAGGDVIRNFGGWGGIQLPLDTSTQQGAIYYIGTAGWTTGYTNPSGTEITLAASSTGSGSVSNLTGRTTSDWYSNAVANSYFTVDLGASRSLLANYLAFRQRSSAALNLTRRLSVYGSNDGSTWTHIMSVINGMIVGGQSAWEYIPLATVDGPFRHYKLVQSGADSSGSNYFCCTEFELFGELVT